MSALLRCVCGRDGGAVGPPAGRPPAGPGSAGRGLSVLPGLLPLLQPDGGVWLRRPEGRAQEHPRVHAGGFLLLQRVVTYDPAQLTSDLLPSSSQSVFLQDNVISQIRQLDLPVLRHLHYLYLQVRHTHTADAVQLLPERLNDDCTVSA